MQRRLQQRGGGSRDRPSAAPEHVSRPQSLRHRRENCPCCPLYLRDWQRRERRCLPLRWARSRRASLQRGRLRASVCQSLLPERSTAAIARSAPSAASRERGSLLARRSLAARRPRPDNRRHDERRRMAADRVARSRGARRRPQQRRQGRLRRGRAAGRGGAASPVTGARTTGSRRRWSSCAARARSASCRAARTSASAAAARCSTCDVAAQVATKQRALEDALWHLGKVQARAACCGRSRARPGTTASARACRCATSSRRARCWSASTSASRASSPTCASCDVVPPHVSDAAAAAARADRRRWRRATACRRSRWRSATACTALVLRHLEPLGDGRPRAAARVRRARTASSGGCSRRGPRPCIRSTARLGARLRAARVRPAHAVPADRLHPGQPRRSTRCSCRARCACSTPAADERVIDWFCGLGNFTLPLATRAARGARHRGQRRAGRARARERAALNGLAAQGELRGAQPVRDRRRRPGRASAAPTKWLIDPPREGAFAIAKALADRCRDRRCAGDLAPPQRIVYVSCNPATLARDAGLLVHQRRLPLRGGGRGQHVPAHRARREHRRLRPRREERRHDRSSSRSRSGCSSCWSAWRCSRRSSGSCCRACAGTSGARCGAS